MTRITQKQTQHLARNPQAYMQFKATGRLPATVRPSSPLITLLEAIPPRLRLLIHGIRLSPDLGYPSGLQFHNAEQLLRWLKPSGEMLVCQSWPADSCRDKRFQRRLNLKDLKPHCATWPDDAVWRSFRISPDN